MSKKIRSDIDDDGLIIEWMPVCQYCIHLDSKGEGPACKAFPNGIPKDIWHGTNHHLTPTKGQKNDIVLTISDDDKEMVKFEVKDGTLPKSVLDHILPPDKG